MPTTFADTSTPTAAADKSTAPNATFRMLYILAIFMVVDGHIGSYDYLNLNNLLRYQNYHLALFMFVSGYFLNLSYGYKEYISKKAARLLLPLYAWNVLYGLLCWILNHYAGFNLGGEFNLYNLTIAPLTNGHQFIYNMGTWFLVPLFLLQTICFCVLKPLQTNRKPAIGALAFFGIALAIGCYCLKAAPANNGNSNFTLLLLRTGYFLPSFALGFLYRHLLEKYDRLNTPCYLLGLIIALGLLEQLFPGYNHIPAWLNFIDAPALAIYGIIFLSILFWTRIARILTPVYEKSRILEYIGSHTFAIMLHQFTALMLIKAALSSIPGFDMTAYKTDIWYLPFIGSESISAMPYIIITIVITLIVEFTSNKIYAKIKKILNIH